MTWKKGRRWSNWSGSVRFRPREVARPRSVEELARLVGEYGRAGRRVRVAGSGHSFTPLVQTDDVLLSMDGLQGITAVDPARGTVTVLGGTQLRRLGNELLTRGLAQENLGDLDLQTITGAISTGTHGTGVRFGNLATQLAGLTLVTAVGEVLPLAPECDADLFRAAQVSLGALGVIAEVTLRVVPAKRLQCRTRPERLESCLANYGRYNAENDHFEFFWLPYTKWVQAKFTNQTDATPTGRNLGSWLNRVVLENGALWMLSAFSRLVQPFSRTACRIAARAIGPTTVVGPSHRIFPSLRSVRFQEMEYSIPSRHFAAVMGEIEECINRHRFRVNFPVECRFVKADDVWFSPTYGRDSAYIAVHVFKGMPYEAYFRAIEGLFRKYEGRPHWGKMHTLDAAALARLYPRWEDFRRVRAALDPHGIFLNDYLRRLLDVG